MKLLKVIGYIIFCRIIYRVKYVGKNNIDKNKNYLVAANHTSWVDAMIVWCLFENIKTMAKAELFNNPVMGWIYKKLGAFPIKRGERDFGSIYHSINILKKEKASLTIFPEGTRMIGSIKTAPKVGAVYLALASGVEILPIHISKKCKLFGRITVTVGESYSLSEFKKEIKDKKMLNEKSKELMKTIYSLENKEGK